MRVRALLTLVRFTSNPLTKSTRSQPLPLKIPTAPEAAARQTPAPHILRPGDYARVQRPTHHAAPTLARVVSSGAHGATVLDDTGKRVRVRHEHILEANARPTPQERALFARALTAQGIPTDTADRFLRLDFHGRPRRRPTRSQLELLAALTEHGTPIDIDGVTESATYEDVQELIRRFVKDPQGRITEG